MSEKDKTILIVIIAFVVMCGCVVVSCCAASLFIATRVERNSDSVMIKDDAEKISFITDDEISEKSSDGLSEAEHLIVRETERIRGLTAEKKLAPVYQTEDELRSYLIDQLKEATDEELRDELNLYYILGFAPKDFDLRQFYIDMYTEQIAGFYDPEKNSMYLIENDSPYNNAVTLAHEYTHFLQYNNPEFKDILMYDDDYCEENGEECIILDSIVEGDATLTENLIDVDSLLGIYKDDSNVSNTESAVFDNAPKFFQDSMVFPYLYGYDFVLYQYMKGGFEKVNDLFLNLPESVEQIMHPEKYLVDKPVNVTLEPFRSIFSDQFEIIQDDVLNESDILMILASGYENDWQLNERQAAAGASGWGGGSFLFGENDDQFAFFSKTVWDSVKEAEEAETVFALYSDKRFGSPVNENEWKDDAFNVYLIRQDDILYWMIFPTSYNSDTLLDMIRNGMVM